MSRSQNPTPSDLAQILHTCLLDKNGKFWKFLDPQRDQLRSGLNNNLKCETNKRNTITPEDREFSTDKSLAKGYGLLKIHKQNIPLRPVISLQRVYTTP